MINEPTILAALRDCYDPEIPLNIVDLGLVQRIAISADQESPGAGIPGVPQKHTVALDLITTTTDEAAQAQLRAQIQNRLAGLPEVSRTTVQLHAEPVWSPQLISPQGRRQLGLDQPAFPILNNRVR